MICGLVQEDDPGGDLLLPQLRLAISAKPVFGIDGAPSVTVASSFISSEQTRVSIVHVVGGA